MVAQGTQHKNKNPAPEHLKVDSKNVSSAFNLESKNLSIIIV